MSHTRMKGLIAGAHVILGSTDPEADRAFFRDVLGLQSVDAGNGWLIFALPPAELAVHPDAGPSQTLYLMCDNLDETLAELRSRGVKVVGDPADQRWGRLATIVLPGGGELSIYEPRHPTPHQI